MNEPRNDSPPVRWWNPRHWSTGVWVLIIGMTVMSIPFAIRTVLLMGIPAIPEPFDVEAFSKWDVPESDNAVTYYRQAAVLRDKALSTIQGDDSVRESGRCLDLLAAGWSEVDEPNRKWLDVHQESLAVWRRGTQQAQGRFTSPSTLEDDWKIRDHQREFARLAILHEARSLSEENADEAYQWARATLRSGGHISHRGGIIAGMTAAAIHDLASSGLAHWAQQPQVTAAQLRQALADVRSDYLLYEPPSNIMKAKYLELRNTLQMPSGPEMICDLNLNGVTSTAWMKIRRLGYWMVAEPELMLRINQQILVNQITEIDKPLAKRRKLVGTSFVRLFDLDPYAPRSPGQLAPTAIDRAVNRSSLARAWARPTQLFDDPMLGQMARQAILETLFAAQAYRRDHGVFPESLTDLVPNYMSAIPLDPFDASGGPILYRRDEPTKAVIWSFGDDRTDGRGSVGDPNRRAPDLGYEIK